MKILLLFAVSILTIMGYYFDVTFAYVLGWGLHSLFLAGNVLVLLLDHKKDSNSNLFDSMQKTFSEYGLITYVAQAILVQIPAILVLGHVEAYNLMGLVLLQYITSYGVLVKVSGYKKFTQENK